MIKKNSLKAVGLISGGLDSTVAIKIIKELGVEVYGVYFAMPWGCCDKSKAQEAADLIGIKFISLQLDEKYLETIEKPKYGYGSALNPCVDCRIHMFSRAAQYMKHIGADFVFTGEVLGQRPMSPMRGLRPTTAPARRGSPAFPATCSRRPAPRGHGRGETRSADTRC